MLASGGARSLLIGELMSVAEAQPEAAARKIGSWWIVGIVAAPIIFVWPLLRRGHSTLARVLGFGWLVVGLLAINVLAQDGATAPEAAPDGQRQAAIEQQRREREEGKRQRELFRTRAVAMIAAEDRVREQLRDPESARFSGTATYVADGADVVCGFVNAKNGFGGMSGKRGYIVVGPMAILEETNEELFAKAWAANCRGSAVQTR